MLLQVCMCVCHLSAVLLYSSSAPWLILLCWAQDWAAQLLTRSQSCSQLPGSLPPSQQFKISSGAGWLHTQTQLCSAAVDDAQRDPLLRRRSICLLRPARTYTVHVILAFTRVYRYTSSLSVQFRSLCHGFGMQRRCGLSRLFYKSQPEINFLSFCTQMGDTSEQPLLAAKVSTCIEILYNNLINIYVMANNWF